MIITQYGIEFFKIQTGDIILAFNPISKQSKHKPSRFGADIALVSMEHPDFNGVENLTYKDKEPFAISGPGEYEIRGVFVKGFGTASNYDGKELINTIYSVQFDGINICFLGPLNSPESISPKIKEDLGDVDILFTPIGGGEVLESSEASKVAVSLAPKIVIPTHWQNGKGTAVLDGFLKDAGSDASPIEKLTLKKKDLEEKEGDIVVLKPVAK